MGTYAVEQALISEKNRVVCLRLGTDFDPTVMQLDGALADAMSVPGEVCALHLVDLREVPEVVQFFQISEPCCLIFFWQAKALKIELGAGPQEKIPAAAITSKEDFAGLAQAA